MNIKMLFYSLGIKPLIVNNSKIESGEQGWKVKMKKKK